ncbi:MAG: hypothetical protein ACR2OG_15015 [Gemmatimonadaceae bacterium]
MSRFTTTMTSAPCDEARKRPDTAGLKDVETNLPRASVRRHRSMSRAPIGSAIPHFFQTTLPSSRHSGAAAVPLLRSSVAGHTTLTMAIKTADVRSSSVLAGLLFQLAISILINYIDRGNLAITAPQLKDELNISAAELGILLGAFSRPCAPRCAGGFVLVPATSRIRPPRQC